MYAHVLIAAAPTRDVLYIPGPALIQSGNSQRVAVALGGGRFDICPVVAGFTSGDDVEILKGLTAGQKVVVSSQFLIDSEANLDAAALRMGFNKPGCRAQPAQASPIGAPPPKPRPPAGGRRMPGMKDMPGMAVPGAQRSRE
jgi:Cu(I)/Ag(I) efflux system membrane fusion protein